MPARANTPDALKRERNVCMRESASLRRSAPLIAYIRWKRSTNSGSGAKSIKPSNSASSFG